MYTLPHKEIDMDKNFYNEASANKLGWAPTWFGEDQFDEDLIKAIKRWQGRSGLKRDGMCGPGTFRRIFTEREAAILEDVSASSRNRNYNQTIICNGELVPIEWDKVLVWGEEGGLALPPENFRAEEGVRHPKFFVNHWDVCLSSSSCFSVLKKRGISVHFAIDNDGTIYQFMDTNDIAWHAGSKKWNNASIGVEISNAYYTKYQSWYRRKGFGERPIWDDAEVHGSPQKPFLGFYDVQLEAAKALMEAVSRHYGIPLECPLDADGELVTTVDPRCVAGRFNGFISHYNLTKRKIDCAGLDLKGLL
jgi:hypothetical protein